MAARVLVVDDNQEKLARLIAVLQEGGVSRDDIDVAQTGVAARQQLVSSRYDLLLLDIAVPLRAEDQPDRRGGIKLLEELLERTIYKRPLSVVGLTAFSELQQEFASQFRANLWTLDLYNPADGGWADRLRAKARYVVQRAEEVPAGPFNIDICVLTALQTPELDALRKLPWGFGPATSLDEVGFYYSGSFTAGDRAFRVVAAAAPRMGMVAAAVLTLKMLLKFRPRLLVMTGICAGLKGACAIGDVLVADPAWDWQMGKHTAAGLSVAPDQIGIQTAVAERCKQLSQDKHLWLDIHTGFSGAKPTSLPTLRVGPVASGSAVVADKKILAEIRKGQHRKLVGVEMELYGIYAAVRDASPPTPITFGMKSVCDYADVKKNDDYQSYAAHVSSQCLAAFCNRYAADLLRL